tara:strand:- start:3323 stop:4087 length:765 start_codon:yes stop_codon:yes gene_type:complete
MLGIFVLLTIIYFLFRVFLTDKFETRNKVNVMKWTALSIYLVTIIGLQVTNTNTYIKKMCGKYDSSKAVLFTIIPNLLIFGALIAILIALPGWKAPFSNTFGYGAAYMMGIKTSFNTLLKTDIDNDLMKKIIQDKSLIVNEITPSNFDLFVAKMSDNNLLTKSYETLQGFANNPDGLDPVKEQPYLDAYKGLFSAVVMKDMVAEGMWYLLTGALVITMITNMVAELECDKSTADMKREYKESGSVRSKMESIKE